MAAGKDAEEKKPAEEKETKKKVAPVELSSEDLELKANLELMVVRAADVDAGVAKLALEGLRKEIRSSTASMTAVPKPLKFLRPHYDTLKATFAAFSV